MSRTIHGLSHKSLKVLRQEPAALAVYWVYVSRTNNEGVAWPSSARLASDLGWAKDTCLKGRGLLVAHEALELVRGYIRPEWRKLDEGIRKRRLSLDKSEYYRPTGYIIVNGSRLPLLYNGADEPSEIDGSLAEHDGLRGRPSAASAVGGVGGRQDSPELNSIPQLYSKGKLDSNPTSAPDGAEVGKPARSQEKKVDKPADPDGGVIAALIDAWLKASGTISPKAFANKTFRETARAMHQQGVKPLHVTDYIQAMRRDAFWATKEIKLSKVQGEIIPWMNKHKPDWKNPAPVETDAAIFTADELPGETNAFLQQLRAKLPPPVQAEQRPLAQIDPALLKELEAEMNAERKGA